MVRVLFLVLCVLGLLWAMGHMLKKTPVKGPRASGVVVTAEDVCKLNRKVPLTQYQKQMCAYLAYEFRNDPVMVEIAFCESSWRHQNEHDGSVRVNVNPDKHQSVDVGLFMPNTYWNGELMQKLGLDPFKVRDNVAIARHLRQKRKYQDWNSSRHCWGWVLSQYS